MTSITADWTAMKQGVLDGIKLSLTSSVPVIWGRQNAPAPEARPHIVLTTLTAPIHEGRAGTFALAGLAVVVETVLDSTSYTFDVGVSTITYTSSATATAAEIVAGLVADLAAKEPTLTVEVIGTTGLRIEHGELALVVTDVNLSCKIVQETRQPAIVSFSVDIIGGPPEETAVPVETVPILTELVTGLRTSEVTDFLCSVGWALVSIEGVRKPDIVAGAKWEDRSGLDVRLRGRISSIKFMNFIETATIDTGIVGSLSR